jgi:hypothetical protein
MIINYLPEIMLKPAKLNPDKFILILYVIIYPKLEAKIVFFLPKAPFIILNFSLNLLFCR